MRIVTLVQFVSYRSISLLDYVFVSTTWIDNSSYCMIKDGTIYEDEAKRYPNYKFKTL